MEIVEEINMKCTREQYESIKDIVGELTSVSDRDFEFYNYLNNHQDGTVFMICKSKSIKSYEKFDKEIFLKACGIETPEISIDYNYQKVISLTRLEIETILGYKIKIIK